MNNVKKTLSKRLWTQSGAMLLNVFVVGGIAYWASMDLKKEIRIQSDVMIPAIGAVTMVDMWHEGIRASVLSGFYISDKISNSEKKKYID